MNLEINDEERRLLTEVVKSRIREVHPEIRRSMDYQFKDELKHELDCYESLLKRLENVPEQRA